MNYWDILLAEKLKKDPPLPPIPDNAYLLEQATGDVITLTDAAALPMPTATTTLTPIQDLHGFSYPWVGGANKNMLPMTVEGIKSLNTSGTWSGNVYSYYNVTYELLTDSANNITGIKVNGTSTGRYGFTLCNANTINFLQSNTYILTGCPTGGSETTYSLNVGDNITATYITYGYAETFTPSNDFLSNNYFARIYIQSGATINNLTFYPMIRLATVTDPTFAPYSNICPISGYDGAEYTRTGVNIWDEEYKIEDNQFKAKNFIKVLPNTTYYFKCPVAITNVYTYDANLSNATRIYPTNNSTFTTGDNVYNIWFSISTSTYGTTYNNDISINYPSTITTYQPYQAQNVTLTFDNTIYSGVIDWCTGVVTVDKGMVDLGDLTYEMGNINNANTGRIFSTTIIGRKRSATQVISSQYRCVDISTVAWETMDLGTIGATSWGDFITICDNYASASDFKTAMDGVQLLYELATPTTIQLTPSQLRTLAGYNTIYTDIGNISLEYWTKEVRA